MYGMSFFLSLLHKSLPMLTIKNLPLPFSLKYKTSLYFPFMLAILLNTLNAKSQDLVKPVPRDTINPASVENAKSGKFEAKFQGEDVTAFDKWVQQRLVSPPAALQKNIYGDVLILYTITPAGKIADVTVLKGRHPLLDAEAIRVVQSSPDWEPAKNAGENVEQRNLINVSFKQDTINLIENQEAIDDSPAFVFVEVKSSFQGGDLNTFREWIKQNLIYPPKAKEQGISGRVTVQFYVDSYGKVVNVKVLRSPDPLFSEETIRVISSSPLWIPAIQQGRNVKQIYVIPVDFNLDDPR